MTSTIPQRLRDIARSVRHVTAKIRNPEEYACELSQIEHDIKNLARQIEEQRA